MISFREYCLTQSGPCKWVSPSNNAIAQWAKAQHDNFWFVGRRHVMLQPRNLPIPADHKIPIDDDMLNAAIVSQTWADITALLK